MASGLAGTIFRQGVGQGFWWLVKTYWPLVLPVLTAAGQYFNSVPWPYFFTGLSIATGAGIWGSYGLVRWATERRLENKIVITMDHLFQAQWHDQANCRYHLSFEVFNGHTTALFMKLRKFTWRLDDDISRSEDITPAQGMIAPGRSIGIASSVITRPNDQTKNIVGGEFEIETEIGKDFGKTEVLMKQVGTFSVLATTDRPAKFAAPVSPKVNKLSFEPITDGD